MKSHICIVCGKEFLTNWENKKCCSKKCYDRYRYINQRERLLEHSKNYHETHREVYRRATRKYYNGHLEKCRERNSNYERTHRNSINERRRRIYTTASNKKCYIKHVYGLTNEQLDELYTKQNGICPICGKSLEQSFEIDHDHSSGMIRGLLHRECNVLISGYEMYLAEKKQYLAHNLLNFNIKYSYIKTLIKVNKDYSLFIDILKRQNYKCPICKMDFSWFDVDSLGRRAWDIDHDHLNKYVRGILCHRCNTLLGKFEKIQNSNREKVENYIANRTN